MGIIRVGYFDDFKGAPTLLIEVDDEGVGALISLLTPLERSDVSVALGQCPGLLLYGGLSVVADSAGESDAVVALNDRHFVWRHSRAAWAEVIESLRAMRGAGPCHQFAGSLGAVDVVVAQGEYGESWWQTHAG